MPARFVGLGNHRSVLVEDYREQCQRIMEAGGQLLRRERLVQRTLEISLLLLLLLFCLFDYTPQRLRRRLQTLLLAIVKR